MSLSCSGIVLALCKVFKPALESLNFENYQGGFRVTTKITAEKAIITQNDELAHVHILYFVSS